VKRSESKVRADGKVNELKFTTIDTAMCTGCHMCVESCGPNAIVQAPPVAAAIPGEQM
jgi:indolepyruvate ferredoxin oxidoreductase alpha subunit